MNKLRYNVSFWLGALFLFVTGGCLDYFDVRPKSQVLADELFSTEEGFSDQLPECTRDWLRPLCMGRK